MPYASYIQSYFRVMYAFISISNKCCKDINLHFEKALPLREEPDSECYKK